MPKCKSRRCELLLYYVWIDNNCISIVVDTNQDMSRSLRHILRSIIPQIRSCWHKRMRVWWTHFVCRRQNVWHNNTLSNVYVQFNVGSFTTMHMTTLPLYDTIIEQLVRYWRKRIIMRHVNQKCKVCKVVRRAIGAKHWRCSYQIYANALRYTSNFEGKTNMWGSIDPKSQITNPRRKMAASGTGQPYVCNAVAATNSSQPLDAFSSTSIAWQIAKRERRFVYAQENASHGCV